jgi:deazaflavin-dependent oxidoreductase (nitroreductase family)
LKTRGEHVSAASMPAPVTGPAWIRANSTGCPNYEAIGRFDCCSDSNLEMRGKENGMSNQVNWNDAIIQEFRANAGKVGGRFAGKTLLLLHSIGAKTKKEHVNPVAYVTDGDRLVIIASKGGAPTHPDWYFNLLANPEATVEVGTQTFRVRAAVAEEPDRTRLYEKMTEMIPSFAEYLLKTSRVIPVIILTREK